MKYFKIVWGFDSEDIIPIDETELEKAFYCFITKKDGVFAHGAVKGDKIIAIQPDFHRAMGWNRGHKLGPDDYAELSSKGVDRSHMALLEDTKAKVQHQLSSGEDTKFLN
jgi:hypothetical protein